MLQDFAEKFLLRLERGFDFRDLLLRDAIGARLSFHFHRWLWSGRCRNGRWFWLRRDDRFRASRRRRCSGKTRR